MKIQSYMDEIKVRLRGKIPQDILDSRLQELRSHLQMSAKDLNVAGDADPEATAISRMGTASLVANQILRSHRGYDTQSPGKLSSHAGAIAFLCLVFSAVFMPYSTGQSSSTTILKFIWLASSLVAICTVVLLAFRTRRWFALNLALWFLVPVSLLIGPRIAISLSNRPNPNEIRQVNQAWELSRQSAFKRLEEDTVISEAWNKPIPPSDPAMFKGPHPIRRRSTGVAMTYLPLSPITFEVITPHIAPSFGLSSMPPEQCAEAWKKYGDSFRAQLPNRRSALMSAKDSTYGNGIVSPEDVKFLLATVAYFLGWSFACNALGLALGKLSDVVATRTSTQGPFGRA